MLFGLKHEAIFALWTLQHFSVASVLGYICVRFKFPFWITFILIILGAYVWELIEYFGEIGHFGPNLAIWFAVPEHTFNRLFISPLTAALGFYNGYAVRQSIVYICIIFALSWFILNARAANCLQVQIQVTQLYKSMFGE